MTKNRLEAFSDGVLAIIITIMVLAFKSPTGSDWHALNQVMPIFLSYALSFIYIAIYWNNHHHLLHATKTINGAIMWANMHLLFWLSLVPFVTGWMAEGNNRTIPRACYGVVLLLSAITYTILQNLIVVHHGKNSALARVLGKDIKGKISLLLYIIGIGLAFVHPLIADSCYVLVALIWVIPDKRLEKVIY